MRTNPFSLRLSALGDLPTFHKIDSAACVLFDAVGLHIDLPAEHPFVRAESARWAESIRVGRSWAICDASGEPVAFLVLGMVDGNPYLDQLAVRPDCMRRGMGTALIEHAFAWAGHKSLWLTTYAHVPWNAPYYERFGFRRVADEACGPQMSAILAEQRTTLPAPEQRLAMVHSPLG